MLSPCFPRRTCWLAAALLCCSSARTESVRPNGFYLPADRTYSIVDSVQDSFRFTLSKTLEADPKGHLVSKSSFVNPAGEIMGWHDFGNLEGPGWAANAVGGALEIFKWGAFCGRADVQSNAVSILDHVLDCGFLDSGTGLIRNYRETTSGNFVMNYKHKSDWLCPGSMAKVGFQLLSFSDELAPDPRAKRLREAAIRCAEWIVGNVEPVPNGWYPRRTDLNGKVYRKSPDGGNDPYWQTSADSLFILQLLAAITERGLGDHRELLKSKWEAFTRAGGYFGSINHDTYDPHENVAYSVAFRVLMQNSRLLKDNGLRSFAFKCLNGLDQFKMCEDRNGVATRGLLYMEKSWDTAYLWENAEAALAFFEAAKSLRGSDKRTSRKHEMDGLVILRACAKHHYGPNGFLTEGVDWNDHVGQQHHIDRQKYAAIQYTEPFLNNQHIAEATLYYLNNLARVTKKHGRSVYRDSEGNLLLER